MNSRILASDASQAPAISVVIAARNVRGTICACLDSLRAQQAGVDFEVIVVDSSRDGSEELIARDYPEVQLLHFAERKYCGGARNAGLAHARAPVVALIDADCVADPGWIGALHRAHQGADLVVGGAIANGNPESAVGWAAYFCEFSAWLPAGRTRYLDDMAGANLSYKREAFERHGVFIEGTYCSDSEFHWRLAEHGERPLFTPDAQVAHHNLEGLVELLRHELEHGRSFARVRSRHRSFSKLRALAHTLGTPLLPARLVGKQLGNVLRSPGYLGRYLTAWPLTWLATCSWTLGEGLGYAEWLRTTADR